MVGRFRSGSTDFGAWSEQDRLTSERELSTLRPFSLPCNRSGDAALAVADSHRVIAEEIEHHGMAGVGTFIVSMTRSLSDLLAVYLLQREAGLLAQTPEGIASLVPVTPFVRDHRRPRGGRCHPDRFLDHPITRTTLTFLGPLREKRSAKPVQQVMIGYPIPTRTGASRQPVAPAFRPASAHRAGPHPGRAASVLPWPGRYDFARRRTDAPLSGSPPAGLARVRSAHDRTRRNHRAEVREFDLGGLQPELLRGCR
ncbi:MAG: phosphoenolpyruvate carboxylase [Fibrobacteres bacterium]|nr:phosphoenolpyruvate carboxylase [Fibrobacterota bacterium]